MSQENLEDEPSNIHVKRPFATKAFKELDRQQNDLNRRLKRKQRRGSSSKIEQLTSRYQICGSSDGKIAGKLQEVIKNGNRIIAQWKNEQINGFAQIYYKNGIYFKGLYQNGIKVKGYFKFTSGFQYIGNCFGNKFAGEGTLKFPNGKTIEGDWKDYEIVGNGRISYPRGEVYYGEIKQFKKHGQGYFYFTDGSKYEGEFRDGLITGKGSYYVQGNLVSSGKWFNGELQQAQKLGDQQMQSTIDKSLIKKDQNHSHFKEFKQRKAFNSTSKVKSRNLLEDIKEPKNFQFN